MALKQKTCRKCGSTERTNGGRCIPCQRAYNVAYRANNIEQVRASRAAYHASHAESERSRNAAYQAANHEARRSYNATWRAANKERKRTTNAAWRAANPEANRIYKHTRRALKRDAGGKLSFGLADKLFKLQRGKCACCGEPLGDDYHLDHIMPLALGGSNTDSNIQLLRQRCNNQKHTKHPIDFMQQRGYLL